MMNPGEDVIWRRRDKNISPVVSELPARVVRVTGRRVTLDVKFTETECRRVSVNPGNVVRRAPVLR